MIPNSFFELMHSLTILDLSGTSIESLPPSLFNLVYLRGLYLRDCFRLKDLPAQVGQLRRLEVLDLGGKTRINFLPREVGELISLKRLIVEFCVVEGPEDTKEWNMKLRVPIGVIKNLPLLEELGMYTPDFVEGGQRDDESMEVVVDELCRLERLTYLDFYFPEEKCLTHFLNGSKPWKERLLRRFRFQVGRGEREHKDQVIDCEHEALEGCGERKDEDQLFDSLLEEYLAYRSSDEISHAAIGETLKDQVFDSEHEAWEGCLVYRSSDEISHAAIGETLAHCSSFHLQDHRATQKLSEFGMENMNELKKCVIEGCDKMETLFDGDGEQQTCAMLPNLEILVIADLSNLRRLWVGRLFPGSLSKLTHLELGRSRSRCLKKVFQVGMIQQLPSLETLIVSSWEVEEIIGIEEETSVPCHANISNNDTVILPNIKWIVLSYLPRLFRFCQGVSLEWPSLESISIDRCPNLKSLSFLTNGTNIVPPALKKIRGPSYWWEALDWEDDDIKRQLQPLLQEYINF